MSDSAICSPPGRAWCARSCRRSPTGSATSKPRSWSAWGSCACSAWPCTPGWRGPRGATAIASVDRWRCAGPVAATWPACCGRRSRRPGCCSAAPIGSGWPSRRTRAARPGNLLVVGPPRSGKGLLATAQLLSWEGSAFVSDPKGELFAATAGWRSHARSGLRAEPARPRPSARPDRHPPGRRRAPPGRYGADGRRPRRGPRRGVHPARHHGADDALPGSAPGGPAGAAVRRLVPRPRARGDR